MEKSQAKIHQEETDIKFISAKIEDNQVKINLLKDTIKVTIRNLMTKNINEGVYKFQDFSETVQRNYENLQTIFSQLQSILSKKDEELSMKSQERIIITEQGDFIFKYGIFKLGKLQFRPEALKTKCIIKVLKNQSENDFRIEKLQNQIKETRWKLQIVEKKYETQLKITEDQEIKLKELSKAHQLHKQELNNLSNHFTQRMDQLQNNCKNKKYEQKNDPASQKDIKQLRQMIVQQKKQIELLRTIIQQSFDKLEKNIIDSQQKNKIEKEEENHRLNINQIQNQIELFHGLYIKKQKQGEDMVIKGQLLEDSQKKIKINCNQQKVDLSYTKITGQQVRAICQLLPNLRQLNLNYCQHIKSIKLKGCKELQELSMEQAQTLTDIQLEQMPALKYLNLWDCSQLQSIKLVQLTQLEGLNLTYCSKLKQAIQLKNCEKIEELWLRGVDQSHQNLVQLLSQQSAQLVKLGLGEWKQIQFSSLKLFNNCKKLLKLYLQQTKITDGEVQRLGTQIPQLEQLSLYGCKKIVNPSLNNFNKLYEIDLKITQVNKQKVQELRKKHPNIKILY